ncbi:hypothetical protein BsWGS_18364 [Bradybaena similaris]
MSKRPTTKSNRKKDAIAYRTRQRLGSVMCKTQPVQHPHCWPLLRELEMAKVKRCRSAFLSPADSCSKRRLPRRIGEKSNFPSVIQRKTYTREKKKTRRAHPRKRGCSTRRVQLRKRGCSTSRVQLRKRGCSASREQLRKRGLSTKRQKSKYTRTKIYQNKQGRLKPKSSALRRSRYHRSDKSRRHTKLYIKRKKAQSMTSRRNSIKRNQTAKHRKEPSSDQDESRDKWAPRRKLDSNFSLRQVNNNIYGSAVISDNLDDDAVILYQACRVMVNNLPGVLAAARIILNQQGPINGRRLNTQENKDANHLKRKT